MASNNNFAVDEGVAEEDCSKNQPPAVLNATNEFDIDLFSSVVRLSKCDIIHADSGKAKIKIAGNLCSVQQHITPASPSEIATSASCEINDFAALVSSLAREAEDGASSPLQFFQSCISDLDADESFFDSAMGKNPGLKDESESNVNIQQTETNLDKTKIDARVKIIAKSCEKSRRPPKRRRGRKVIHNVEETYRCTFCGKQFKSSLYLERHVMSVHFPFKCTACQITFTNEAELSEHNESHKKNSKNGVSSSEVPFNNNDGIREIDTDSMTQMDTDSISNDCIDTTGEYDKELHTSNCKINNLTKIDSRTLQTELVSTDTEFLVEGYNANLQNYAEDAILSTDQSRDNFARRPKYREQSEMKFLCSQCGKLFLKEFFLQRHIAFHHATVRLMCNICNEAFSFESELLQHLHNHHAPILTTEKFDFDENSIGKNAHERGFPDSLSTSENPETNKENMQCNSKRGENGRASNEAELNDDKGVRIINEEARTQQHCDEPTKNELESAHESDIDQTQKIGEVSSEQFPNQSSVRHTEINNQLSSSDHKILNDFFNQSLFCFNAPTHASLKTNEHLSNESELENNSMTCSSIRETNVSEGDDSAPDSDGNTTFPICEILIESSIETASGSNNEFGIKHKYEATLPNESGSDLNLDSKKYNCPWCGAVFCNSSHLAHHIEKDCSKCDERFLYMPPPKYPTGKTVRRNKVPCHLCSKTFFDKSALSRHVKNIHKRFSPLQPFPTEERRKLKKKQVTCSQCSETFDSKRKLRAHVKKVHGNDREKRKSTCVNSAAKKRSMEISDEPDVIGRIELSRLAKEKNPEMSSSKSTSNRHSLTSIETVKQVTPESDTAERSYQACRICGKKILSAWYMESHMKLHGARKLHTCQICGKQLLTSKFMAVHMKQHRGRFSCEKCNVKFSTQWYLTSHRKSGLCKMQAEHRPSEAINFEFGAKFGCCLCRGEFESKSQLRIHMMIHFCTVPIERLKEEDIEKYQCMKFNTDENKYTPGRAGPSDTASRQRKRENPLYVSRKKKAIPSTAQYARNLRRKRFFTKTHKHLKSHLVGKLECDHCGVKFPLLNLLREHLLNGKCDAKRRKHETHRRKFPKENHSEPIVDRQTDDPAGFLNREIKQEPLENGFPLSEREGLESVKRENDDAETINQQSISSNGDSNLLSTGSKLYAIHQSGISRCGKCGKVLKSMAGLRKHMAIHRERLPCAECEQSFLFEYSLAQHMELHNLNRRFACLECNYRYSRFDNLARHLKIHVETPFEVLLRRHNEELMYKCQICGTYWAEKRFLKKHLKCHDVKKIHACSFCTYRFSRLRLLEKHSKIHTAITAKES